MKKDRNSFFQSSNFNMSASNIPMGGYQMPQNMGFGNVMMPQNMGSVNSEAQFYQGGMASVIPYSSSELEAKIARIERSINRLEARINKLESTSYYAKDGYDDNGNMYIV